MYVNCAHGKGIKFIRDDLKFFAKTNIQGNKGILFKTIVLFNADSLTIDAQSAMRRCIESFSYNTRFFIVVENMPLFPGCNDEGCTQSNILRHISRNFK